jgi:tRNA A-37 threonylcarbamoyl transferase component Bud32
MSSCFNCETPVSTEDRFCGNCGIALQAQGGGTGDAQANGGAPSSNNADLLDAGGSSSALLRPTGDHSARLIETGVETPSQSDAASGAEESPAGAQDDYSAELQPTIIESSFGGGGGGATAAARAHEPVQSAEEEPPASQNFVEEPPASQNLADESSASQNLSDSSASSRNLADSSASSQNLSDASSSLSDSTADAASDVSASGVGNRTTPNRTTPNQPEVSLPVEPSQPADEPQRHTAGEDGRRTGDLPSRGPAYVGRTAGSSRRASSQLEPGTLLYNRYEIVKRIGGGGMGAVYYAKDKNLGDAPRAVKEMIQSHLDESQQEKAVADFKRESMLLASLEHPSIPTIYDYFYDDTASRFYLVMKYISGGDCLARLRNAPGGRIDELTVSDWGAQAADVLEYLHNQRPPIIYRDLKPANLMLDGNNGRVMLIDFGIARWVAPQEKGVTAVGTMGYAPPELFSGKAESRTDIYGLGATMFHLLTGSDPQDNPLLIFDFTKNPSPRQINPAVSNEMEWILMRAVEYEPERRFRSAADMRDTLMQHSERLRAGAVTYGVVRGAQSQASMSTLAVERVFCGFCGKSISSEDVFCPHCGARQPIAAASASLRAARATARLVVTGTTELDATFILNKETNLVGRTDPQSNIFPDIDLSKFDPETKISRRHARIWREGETFLVEDLGSVNGTVVNDSVRLGPRQPRPLATGDRLRLGETTLHFLVG